MLKRIEEGAYVPSIEQRSALRAALEDGGVEFTNGDTPGVRLKVKARKTTEPLNNLSSNHAEQDRDREEQPLRLRIPRVRLFPLGRVRLLILLLVRLHAPSYEAQYEKPRPAGGC